VWPPCVAGGASVDSQAGAGLEAVHLRAADWWAAWRVAQSAGYVSAIKQTGGKVLPSTRRAVDAQPYTYRAYLPLRVLEPTTQSCRSRGLAAEGQVGNSITVSSMRQETTPAYSRCRGASQQGNGRCKQSRTPSPPQCSRFGAEGPCRASMRRKGAERESSTLRQFAAVTTGTPPAGRKTLRGRGFQWSSQATGSRLGATRRPTSTNDATQDPQRILAWQGTGSWAEYTRIGS
jgi:hypothetical protein